MPHFTELSYRKIAVKVLTSCSIGFILACSGTQNYEQIGAIEELDPAFRDLVTNDAKVEIIADGFEWSEGPLWVESEQMLLFSDIPNNTIFKWTEKAGKELYLKPAGYTGEAPRGGELGSNGLLLDNTGQLILCQHGDRRIARMDAPINKPEPKFTTLAGEYQGKKFDSPNDAVLHPNGDIYFTDPPYGLEKYIDDSTKAAPYQGVYRIGTNGKVDLLVDSINRPNGIGLMPDGKTLIVANSESEKAVWYAFDLGNGDSLTNARIFFDASSYAKTTPGGPDGFKIDKAGNVYATGPGGIWFFNKDAKPLGRIKLPVASSNCALSADEKTLYITADMYLLRVKLR
ncbi:SMP-30/gluconolactonase/LRE family protein [Flavihumibacter sp. RY-1]|uniref:SMP-30/gluconolactonase/LRE family protein n=1 Tax=Flavihumibacter fluminis TaxID=2909236 RepID=A0ABS9BJE7_9BACT|nr:SMP-30/gluconolactonase/LRE family protein [Flavihumibacter fluminis]MCF1714954.1 SMP-30/gluconolactonase/LRE family protein [Flavihumibacter fluminis]